MTMLLVLLAQILHDLPVIVVQLYALGLRDDAYHLVAIIGRDQIAVSVGLQLHAIHHVSHVVILLAFLFTDHIAAVSLRACHSEGIPPLTPPYAGVLQNECCNRRYALRTKNS